MVHLFESSVTRGRIAIKWQMQFICVSEKQVICDIAELQNNVVFAKYTLAFEEITLLTNIETWLPTTAMKYFLQN